MLLKLMLSHFLSYMLLVSLSMMALSSMESLTLSKVVISSFSLSKLFTPQAFCTVLQLGLLVGGRLTPKVLPAGPPSWQDQPGVHRVFTGG